ncbi:MAG: hypothetical protein JO027_17365, partial [Solirubrobacterales bacterium]|nr:hypothetical protein [Solirubrobacterales bacterium]
MRNPQESPTAPGLHQGTASASRKATLTVARAIAQTLSAYGVSHYFCVTGGDHDLWLALDEVGIGIVNCRS